MSPFIRRSAWLSCVCFAMFHVAAQEVCEAKPRPKLEQGAYVFAGPGGTTFCWKRPEQVRFAIVRACGGGGSGLDAWYPSARGPDGLGGRRRTEIVGPLTAASYEVVLGKGGIGGKYDEGSYPGTATTFLGSDAQLTFSGGAGLPAVGALLDQFHFIARYLDLPRNTAGACSGGAGGFPDGTRAEAGKPGELILVPVMDVEQTREALQAAEVRLEGIVVENVNGLPRKILTDTAATSIRDAVLLQLEERLEQLRNDIEALKR